MALFVFNIGNVGTIGRVGKAKIENVGTIDTIDHVDQIITCPSEPQVLVITFTVGSPTLRPQPGE